MPTSSAALALDPFALADASEDAVTSARTEPWVRARALPRLPATAAPSDGSEAGPEPEGAEGAATAPQSGGASLAVYVPPEHHEPEHRAELVVGPDLSSAADYASSAWSENTKRAYKSQIKNWRKFCHDRGYCPLPCIPAVLASYIAHRADGGTKPATIAIALAAIGAEHKRAGYSKPSDAPIVEETWRGVRRRLGVAPVQKAPLSPTDITAMVGACDVETLIGLRDVAIITLGFGAAMRRSEIVGLELRDVAFDDRGVTITIRKSKTDQESKGQHVAVTFGSDARTCPVRALQRWIAAAGIVEPTAPLFVRLDHGGAHRMERAHDRMIARRIKVLAKRVGLDASKFSGHSLRSGHATSAYRLGRPLLGIQRQGRWSSPAMLATYIRRETLFDADNSSRGLL